MEVEGGCSACPLPEGCFPYPDPSAWGFLLKDSCLMSLLGFLLTNTSLGLGLSLADANKKGRGGYCHWLTACMTLWEVGRWSLSRHASQLQHQQASVSTKRVHHQLQHWSSWGMQQKFKREGKAGHQMVQCLHVVMICKWKLAFLQYCVEVRARRVQTKLSVLGDDCRHLGMIVGWAGHGAAPCYSYSVDANICCLLAWWAGCEWQCLRLASSVSVQWHCRSQWNCFHVKLAN